MYYFKKHLMHVQSAAMNNYNRCPLRIHLKIARGCASGSGRIESVVSCGTVRFCTRCPHSWYL